MLKYVASTIKDIILLLRDRAGLVMLFVMPAALIIIMTLLQDSTFRALEERKLPILVLNYDNDTFGINIVEDLKESRFFEVVEQTGNEEQAEIELKDRVANGDFQIGIIIHKNATNIMQNNIKYYIVQQLPDQDKLIFGEGPIVQQPSTKISIYFDPVIKNSFKQSITSALQGYSSSVESKMLYGVYSSLFRDMLGIELKNQGDFNQMVAFETLYASSDGEIRVPNSVQHNVPAWTIFAMFFIVIPLAGNIIKERESGVSLRLKIIAGSNLSVIMGKVTTFFFIGLLQAITMLLIGVWILPLLDLPQLVIGNNFGALILLTVSVSLAASGYGIIIGTIATSQEQSSIFGSISVVILAALGGIWVPVFIMSEAMQQVSKLSPLNWAINGYYDIFLRKSGVGDILGYVVMLMIFFLLCITIAWYYNRYHRRSY